MLVPAIITNDFVSYSKISIRNFPDDTLIDIMSHLTHQDILSGTDLVCRRWRVLSKNPRLKEANYFRQLALLSKADSVDTLFTCKQQVRTHAAFFLVNKVAVGIFFKNSPESHLYSVFLNKGRQWDSLSAIYSSTQSKFLNVENEGDRVFVYDFQQRLIWIINLLDKTKNNQIEFTEEAQGCFPKEKDNYLVGCPHGSTFYYDDSQHIMERSVVRLGDAFDGSVEKMVNIDDIVGFSSSKGINFLNVKTQKEVLSLAFYGKAQFLANRNFFYVFAPQNGYLKAFQPLSEQVTTIWQKEVSHIDPLGVYKNATIQVNDDWVALCYRSNDLPQGLVRIFNAKTGNEHFNGVIGFDFSLERSFINPSTKEEDFSNFSTSLKNDFFFCMIASELRIMHLPTKQLFPTVKLDADLWVHDVNIMDDEVLILAYSLSQSTHKVFQRKLA